MNSFKIIRSSAKCAVWAASCILAVIGNVTPVCGLELHVPKGAWPGHAPGRAQTVAVSGNHAYMANGDSGLQIIDVSNPAKPQRVGGYDTANHAKGVAISGNQAFVVGTFGLQIFDVTNPALPQKVGTLDISGYTVDVAISGKYVYVAEVLSGLQIIDVSNPALPHRVGSLEITNFAYDVEIFGTNAYVVDEMGGLQIINVSNPAIPCLVGSYQINGAGAGVAISGNYAFVAGDYTGLHVIDVSNPSSLQRVAFVGTRGVYRTRSVSVSGQYAYVADATTGLHVFDISNPVNPQWVGACKTSGDAEKVTTRGSYAYVANGTGLQIIHVDLLTRKSLPFLVSGTPGQAISIQRSRNLSNWEDWRELSLTTNLYEFADPDTGTEPHRFYRVLAR